MYLAGPKIILMNEKGPETEGKLEKHRKNRFHGRNFVMHFNNYQHRSFSKLPQTEEGGILQHSLCKAR